MRYLLLFVQQLKAVVDFLQAFITLATTNLQQRSKGKLIKKEWKAQLYYSAHLYLRAEQTHLCRPPLRWRLAWTSWQKRSQEPGHSLKKKKKIQTWSKRGQLQAGAKTEILQQHTSFFSFFGAVLGAIRLLGFAVPAWTSADTHLEAPAAQNKSPRKEMKEVMGLKKKTN